MPGMETGMVHKRSFDVRYEIMSADRVQTEHHGVPPVRSQGI